MLVRGEQPPGEPRDDEAHRRTGWPDDLAEIVYVDHFGNAMTGIRAATLPSDVKLLAAGRMLDGARIFSDRALAAGFWYENSNGSLRWPSTRA